MNQLLKTLGGLAVACYAFSPGQAQAQFGYGMGTPGANVPGVNNTFYAAPWAMNGPYYPNGYTRSGPIIFPGFVAIDPPRSRPTIYPAIPTPSKDVIAAALDGSDDTKAILEVHVPTAGARVWLNGVATTQTGATRTFKTPALNSGSEYSYQIRVVILDTRGLQLSSEREVMIRPGETKSVTFTPIEFNRN